MGPPVDTGLVVAVVLAGGAGRRLGGVDKAGLVLDGRTLLDRVLSAAAGVAGRLVVVGPPRLVALERAVIFVQEETPGGGPVPAVGAALDAMGGASVTLLLAVDLPLLTSTDLARLLDTLVAAGPSVGAVAAAGPAGRPNPLLAAYRTPVFEGMESVADAPAWSLLPDGVEVVDLGPRASLNVNTPADLARAESFLTDGPTRGRPRECPEALPTTTPPPSPGRP